MLSQTQFSRWLVLCLCLLCSCREKKGTPAAQTTSVPSQDHPTPAQTARKPTWEQLASVLRVRVAFGGLPPRDTTAALLHRDEIPDKTLVEGYCRFVLAPLKGWHESQLRSDKARILVYRNKVNASGTTSSAAFPARLMQFDAATGLALLAYLDDFDYPDDAGFHLQRDDATHSGVTLLRTFRNPAEPLPVPNRVGGQQTPFSVDAGVWREFGGTALAEFPPLDPHITADPVQLAVNEPDKLAGFVDTSAGGPVLTPLDRFSVAIKTPIVEVTNVDFDTRSMEGRFRIDLTVQADASEMPKYMHMRLHYREVSRDEIKELPKSDAAGAFAPISNTSIEIRQQMNAWSGILPNPAIDQEKLYLMQISWSLLPQKFGPKTLWPPTAPAIYGRPFLIKIERGADGLSPMVMELPGPAGSSVAETAKGTDQAEPPERFALEAAARDVHLVAGGRAALIELDGAPYWKLFSFEKKHWVPLPGNLASTFVTGNLNAIFILNRDTLEVRKFDLPGLEPAGLTKLPPADYKAILAGCNTERGPVHVIAPDGSLALDAGTLQRRDAPRRPATHPPSGGWDREDFTSYSITGDGLSIRRIKKEYDHGFIHYNSDARGLELSYLGVTDQNFGRVPGVTGGFNADDGFRISDTPGGQMRDLGRPSEPWTYTPAALAENAPVVFRLQRPGERQSAVKQPRLGCFAFSSALPFAELDVPELNSAIKEQAWKFQHWIFFDPYSQRLATLSSDRKTWFVREVTIDANRGQPVLMNWPDTTVARGGKFIFQPRLAGGTKFNAILRGKPGSVNETSGTVEFSIAANEFDSLQLLDFKVPGKEGAEISYPMLVHIAGPELPFITAPVGNTQGLNARGASLANLGYSSPDVRPLAAAFVQLADPVVEMQGPVAGCAALVSANRVDFLSLQTRQIVGSTTVASGASFYVGAGALLEYDPGKRTLTRINVPGGKREQFFFFPPKSRLRAMGVGTDPDSPVTVLVEITEGQSWLRFSDVTITTSAFRTTCAVLDGLTLKAGSRAQPASFSKLLAKGEENAAEYFGAIGALETKPVPLPTSRNGAMVTLPGSFLALGITYAVVYPFGHNAGVNLGSFTAGRPSGSLSGLLAFSSMGEAFKAGVKTGAAEGYKELGASPCGRYQFRRMEIAANDNCLDVRLAENGEPLLRAARLAFMETNQFIGGAREQRRVVMLGDEGPLGILSESGRTLELVDLNIPAAMKSLAPEKFHVISQPVPYVMEGRTAQYQVQVNNPDVVQGYRLQTQMAGASISPQGLLIYQAPAKISEPTNIAISIEVIGQKGKTVLHEFPMYVLPWPRPGTKAKTP